MPAFVVVPQLSVEWLGGAWQECVPAALVRTAQLL